MGEVIEISIISHKNDFVEKVIYFMENIFDLHNGIQNIETMDNWYYENTFSLKSLEEAKKYMDSKIITFTKSSFTEQIGVSIEHSSDCYCYQFWYNPKQELSENECKDIYKILVNYILDKRKDDILICGIGREISMDFNMNIEEIIEKSHNIDIWIIKKNIYANCRLEGMLPKIILI